MSSELRTLTRTPELEELFVEAVNLLAEAVRTPLQTVYDRFVETSARLAAAVAAQLATVSPEARLAGRRAYYSVRSSGSQRPVLIQVLLEGERAPTAERLDHTSIGQLGIQRAHADLVADVASWIFRKDAE